MATIALRISRTFNDLSGIMLCFEGIPNVLIYQHDADEDITRTHCHFLLEKSPIDTEGLKKRILKIVKFFGNSDWSTSQKEYTSSEKYISYMSKGILEPVYNKGYETTHIDTLKALWLIPQRGVIANQERITAPDLQYGSARPIVSQQTLIEQYQAYLDELLENVSTMSPNLTLDHFRGPSLLYWRKRNGGLLPQTSTYKRFLASLYLEYRDHKRLPLAEEAIQDISKFYA